MFGAMFMFAIGDMFAKLLTDTFHPVQIIWFRQSGLLLGVIILLLLKGPTILRSAQPSLQLLRGTLVVGSSLAFVFAVRYVELADATAASFVAPFFVTMLGAFWLKEKVGVRRWLAVLIGFIGALIITRPGMGVIHPSVLLVVIAAALFSAVTTVAYTALTASLLISLALPFYWQLPTSSFHWLVLFAMAVVAGLAEVLVIKALEIAEAARVAPIHYTIIIWATLWGYLVFGQLPDGWTLLGTIIIIAAGLYTLERGKRKQTA